MHVTAKMRERRERSYCRRVAGRCVVGPAEISAYPGDVAYAERFVRLPDGRIFHARQRVPFRQVERADRGRLLVWADRALVRGLKEQFGPRLAVSQ